MTLESEFGNIDIYLFDQLLKGRIKNNMKILDAGCGYGRNIVYLLQNGFNVSAVDYNPDAVEYCKGLLHQFSREELIDRFTTENLNELSFEDCQFDFIISSAVLHFAKNPDEFEKQFSELYRVLKPGGILFARLASSIGLEPNSIQSLGNRRYHLPDGSDRFLVDKNYLIELFSRFHYNSLDPIKTSLVDNMRAMTTLVCEKENR